MSCTAVRFTGLEMCSEVVEVGRFVEVIYGCTFYRVSDYGSSRVGPADASFLLDTASVLSDTTNGMYCKYCQ
jgi:hypothetical protein